MRARFSVLAVVALGSLVAALVASLAVGCHRAAPIHLENADVRTGDDVVVSIDRDLDGRAPDRYWIALQPAEMPDSDVSGRVLVPRGEKTVHLRAVAPGAYEVRLHDRYPKEEHHLVARVPVHVDGYAVQTSAPLEAFRR